jgi:hypothetical protein
MKKVIQFIQNNILLIIINIICIFVLIFIIPKLEDNVEFDQQEKEYYKNYYLERGKSIGRNAMIKYLHEANELDSNVIIDVKKLLKIEKNIENKTLNKNNNE